MNSSGPPLSQWFAGGVYFLTDDSLSDEQLLRTVEQALRGGARCVQLRDKRRDTRDLHRLAARLRALTARMGAGFIINDRIDLALAVGADGAHIGQVDIPARDARRLLGPQRVLGVSADSPERARRAVADGADYLGVGHVFGSVAKEKNEPPIGVEGLATVCEGARVPVVAIGAVNSENAAQAIESGASAVAVISAISRTEDPEASARELASVVRSAYEQRKTALRRSHPPAPEPERAGSALETLRNQQPLIQIIADHAVVAAAAGATELIGAHPLTSEAEEEAGEMVRRARALLVNTGAPTSGTVRAMRRAADSARRAGVPVVLDPRGSGASAYRVEVNQGLARAGAPAIVRGNAPEIGALIGRRIDLRGVDEDRQENDSYDKARIGLARAAASQLGTVVVVTGPVDVVCDGRATVPRIVLVGNGTSLSAGVVGGGCIVSGLIASFAAIEGDPFLAALWGLGVMGVAAEQAAAEQAVTEHTDDRRNDRGRPMRFRTALLDRLYAVTPEQLASAIRLEWPSVE